MINARNSVWFLEKSLDSDAVMNDVVYLMSNQILKGRKKIKSPKILDVGTSSTRSNNESLTNWVDKNIRSEDLQNKGKNTLIIKETLSSDDQKYIESEKEFVDVLNIDSNIFDPKKINEFERQKREVVKANLVSLAKGSINKGQKVEANFKNYHELNKFEDGASFKNTFDDFLEKYDEDRKIKSKYHGSKKYLDPLWSSDLSDKDLREFFLKSEKQYEFDRKNTSVGNLPSNEIFYALLIPSSSKLQRKIKAFNQQTKLSLLVMNGI